MMRSAIISTARIGDGGSRRTRVRRATQASESVQLSPPEKMKRFTVSSMSGRALWLYDVKRRSTRLLAREDADVNGSSIRAAFV